MPVVGELVPEGTQAPHRETIYELHHVAEPSPKLG